MKWPAILFGIASAALAAGAAAGVEEAILTKLKGAGVSITEGEVRRRMDELLAQARESVRSGE